MQRFLKFAVLVVLLAALAATQTPATPVKYWVQYHDDDQNYVTVHLTKKLLGERFSTSSIYDFNREKGPPLFRELQEVHGVENVVMNQYSVQVKKGAAFDWDEILPEVLQTIGKHVGRMELRPPKTARPSPCPETPASKAGDKL